MSESANLPTSQIGIRWSGTKKCSQRCEIDHFFRRSFAGIQPSECFRDPVRESSVLPIQYPIGGWGQGSKLTENGPKSVENGRIANVDRRPNKMFYSVASRKCRIHPKADDTKLKLEKFSELEVGMF